MAYHARLSPSDSSTWIPCPGSIHLREKLPRREEKDSIYSLEGTAAHDLGELKASLAFGKISTDQFLEAFDDWFARWEPVVGASSLAGMEPHTDEYVAFLVGIRDEMGPDTAVFLERRVYPGIPECDGTADAILVSPTAVHIVDLKYGAGVFVDVAGNPQLRIYAVGALEEFGDVVGDTELVSYSVFQPRTGNHATETTTPEELREWRDSIIPIAEDAIAGSDVFSPSEKACRWCSASGRCDAQLQAIFSEPLESVTVNLLSPEEIAASLDKIPLVKTWLSAVESIALETAYTHDTPIPGYKVVRAGGKRGVRDEGRAADALLGAGYDPDQFSTRKIKGIGELETLLGPEEFKTLLTDPEIVTKSEGKPCLVPESDKRPPISRASEAAAVFGEFTDE